MSLLSSLSLNGKNERDNRVKQQVSSSSPQLLTVLGATGTIGVNTLDVVARHPDRYQVFALSGGQQIDKLAQQCIQFQPRYAVTLEATSAAQLQQGLRQQGCTTEVLYGAEALQQIAAHPDVDAVMAAIVGAAGLPPALAAAQAGKKVLLANKEALVMAGRFFMEAVTESGAHLLPIDSEHNAIFQSLPADCVSLAQAGVEKIILTASGGPFRQVSAEALSSVTPAQACAHPNWVMGRKISVDSASLMNKGLEVIEARWLFDATPEQIEVVVHPQSVIHSMVRYRDGSVLAQLGTPDMRTPIAHALAWPERITAGVAALDFLSLPPLTFEQPDLVRFPALGLAFAALQHGADAPAVLNAANEIAVAAFLEEKIRFTAIPQLVENALTHFASANSSCLDDLFALDQAVRRYTLQQVEHMTC